MMMQDANGIHLVVCDDESHIRHMIASKLRATGYDVAEGRDGQEALELITRRQPALLITDYQMPRLSGIELCRMLKASPSTRSLRALMLTARGYVLTPEEISQTNIVQLIPKPFGLRQLVLKVEELLGKAGGVSAMAA